MEGYPFLSSIAPVEEEGVRRRAGRVVGFSTEGKRTYSRLMKVG